MFNLTSFQNSDGIVEVKTLDSFYSSSTKIWDITEFIDKSESSVDTVLPFKQVDFSYEGLDNFFAKNHLELFNKKWGAENYTAIDVKGKIEGETYKVSIPLEHFKYERLKDVNGGSFKDLLWGWSADIKQEPNLGKPLLFYPILSTQDIGVIDSDGSLNLQTDVFIPSNSVRLTDSKNLNFSAEPNEYLGTPFKKTLFAEYYINYIKEIFDAQRRLTTVKAYLPISITLDLSLADKVRIFENLYKINKINTNFETNQSTLELINVKPTAGEAIDISPIVPDKFAPNSVCITADSTVYFADSFIITADADCDVEGLEIKSTTEVIPNAVDAGNKPQTVDHSVPMPVTQALSSLSPQGFTGSNTVMFSALIDKTGLIGNVSNWAEYGVFWTTSLHALNSTDFSVLDTNSLLTKIAVQSSALNKHSAPKSFSLKVTALSPNTKYYYKAYIKTNADSNYNTGDETIAITETGFRKTLSNIENKFLRRSAKLGTSIARRSGQGGLALGAADALVAEPDRPTLFYEPVSEEGKTGRDLAAARFINKVKFGQEGATFGVGFAFAGKALPIGAKYGLYKPGAFALGIGAKAVDKVVTPVSKVAARIPGIQVPFQLANRGGELLVKELGTRVILESLAI